MAVNLHTTHFRFGNDDGTESGHTFKANLDTSISLDEGSIFLLRFTVQETGGTAAGNVDQQFQCALNGGTFQNITTTSTIVKAVAVGAFTNGQDATKRLTGTGTFESSGDGCTEDGLSGGAQNDIAASGNSETEAGLQLVAADVAAGDAVTFRLTSPDFTITNDVVPTITVTSANQLVTPGTASLTTTRFVPVVSVTDNKLVTPGTATLATTRFTPTVTATANQSVTPGTATLTTATFAPSVTVGVQVTPGVAALALSALTPTVTATVNVSVTPGTATLATTLFAPTALTPRTVTPGTTALSLSALTPVVTATANLTVTPGTAAMVITRFAPDISAVVGAPPNNSTAVQWVHVGCGRRIG